jgi:hypothetical protein
MIPGAFLVLEQLPLSPNGKVNRQALPDGIYSQLETTYTPPSNKEEE